MLTSEFDYDLPPDLIAQTPATTRRASRLLHVARDSGLIDRTFGELPLLLHKGDVVVLNDTRVLRARLRGHKQGSGGAVELMIERVVGVRSALVQMRASKAPRTGTTIVLNGGAHAMVRGRQADFFVVDFDRDVAAIMQESGELPLPPYIQHAPAAQDDERYQTVYAREPGAVAAPTAGLHFDQEMLAELQRAGAQLCYVTLHVGAGTFQPVRVDDLAQHRMHSERYTVPEATVQAIRTAHASGARVLAVGTTSLRALESAARGGDLSAGSAETDLFITPGYRFRVVDLLLTNFHLPRSTLLMLVSAFGGYDKMMRAYRHAVEQRYRFFSYGDAMLIERAAPA